MSTEAKKPRRSSGRTYDKLAISMPRETVARMRQQAKALGVPSVSAYITRVVEERLEERTFDEILDEVFRENPMTDEERAWAESVLGR